MRLALALALLLVFPAPGHAQFERVVGPANSTSVGYTLIKPCPGAPAATFCAPLLLPYPSLNVASTIGTAHWLLRDPLGAVGNVTNSVVWADTGTNGGRSGGVFQKKKVTGTKTKALRCLAYDQRQTDWLKLETIEWTTATGVVTSVVPLQPWLDLDDAILVYAGSDRLRADCECRPDKSCHAYCQQVRIALTTETLDDRRVRYTCSAATLGAGAPGNGRHYDPFDPAETLIGEVVYEGPRPAGLAGAEASEHGIAAANVQGVIASSFQRYEVLP